MKRFKLLCFFLSAIFTFSFCSSGNEDNPDSSLEFTTSPQLLVDHNRSFLYSFSAKNEANTAITYQVDIPDWLTYDETSHTISGVPDWERLNSSFTINIEASDGDGSITQRKNISVQLGEILCNAAFGDPASSEYVLPYEVGESFKLSQSYCPSNPNWGHHNWFAYDFDMPIGTPLLASRSGRVIAVRQNQRDDTRVCGEENYVFILHDDGTVASYVHLTLNGAEVAVDQRVAQGELIGYSGDSGCSIGPHLHLGIFRQRGPYDRQYTMPVNFTNAEGPLNAANGLVQDGIYTAK
ncbi:MAG: peptidoglycan DD-metalloendopeptidase family protein [Roseivirga sp.]|nr:peptidoglycan DD-metalloendopeptidase family protein [Roseivirga sp.]